MIDLATPNLRLSWDARFPAPFESGWSIFVKVIVLNNISAHELVKLIKRDDVFINTAYAMDCSNSRWIDFVRFAALLGIKEHRLRTGFWDQLGIKLCVGRRYEIRRCPKCWEHGYHCVLFDLLGLAGCPWHRCSLTKGCDTCAAGSTFNIRTSYDKISARYCTRCSLQLPDLNGLLATAPMAQDRAATIVGYCRELIDWWAGVERSVPERDLLLADVMTNSVTTHDRRSYRAWQTSFASTVTGEDGLSWMFKDDWVAVKHTSWYEDGERTASDVDDGNLRGATGAAYRSLRRHIYRTYVKKHHACVSCLSNLSRDQSHALDADEVCIVSLAFLVWRMSIEGLCNVEGLRLTTARERSLRLMTPEFWYAIPFQSRMQWSYYGFFGLWHRLFTECADRNVRVEINGQSCDGHFHWVFETPKKVASADTRELPSGRFHALVPDVGVLLQAADDRCRSRRKRRAEMVDNYKIWSDGAWAWARDERNLRHCLFQLRHPNARWNGGQFWYVNV